MEKKTDGTITFELTIPWKKVSETFDHVVEEIGQKVEVKGFRKGKAPAHIVVDKVGKDTIYQNVVEHILPEEYAQFVQKNKIKPIVYPQIKTLEIKEGSDWKFEVTTATRPELELGDYKKYITKANKSVAKTDTKAKSKKKEEPKKKTKEQNQKLQNLFDTLLKNAKLEAPHLLVQQEARENMSKLVHELEKLNLSIDDYAKSQKMTAKQLISEYEKTAESRIKLELILEELTKKEDPEITDEELKKLKVPEDQKDYVINLLKRQKTVDRLLLL